MLKDKSSFKVMPYKAKFLFNSLSEEKGPARTEITA